MTGRDLKALVEDMERRGLLDKDICVFDYDDGSMENWMTLYKNDKDHTMVEYNWTGTQFEYSEFDGETGEPVCGVQTMLVSGCIREQQHITFPRKNGKFNF